MTPSIGTLNETSLHAALKKWYAQPGDKFEVSIDGFQIDIVREKLLVEIRIKNFSASRDKLHKLIRYYPVRLVYPLTHEKWLIVCVRWMLLHQQENSLIPYSILATLVLNFS